MPVRAKTSVAGEISFTATRINKYGMPQITDIIANRIKARRACT